MALGKRVRNTAIHERIVSFLCFPVLCFDSFRVFFSVFCRNTANDSQTTRKTTAKHHKTPAKHHKTQSKSTFLHLHLFAFAFAYKTAHICQQTDPRPRPALFCKQASGDVGLCQTPRQSLTYLRLRLYYMQRVHICAFRFRSTFHVRLWGVLPLLFYLHTVLYVHVHVRARIHTHTLREILTCACAQYKIDNKLNPHISLSLYYNISSCS